MLGSLIKDEMHQKFFLMLTKSWFQNIKRDIKCLSGKSPFIQVLHQKIRVGGGGGEAKIMENNLT